MKSKENDALPLIQSGSLLGRTYFLFFVHLSIVLVMRTQLSKTFKVVKTFEMVWLDAPKSKYL